MAARLAAQPTRQLQISDDKLLAQSHARRSRRAAWRLRIKRRTRPAAVRLSVVLNIETWGIDAMCCVVKKLASTKLSAPRASRSLRALKEGNRYIERPADAALLRTLQSGEHAYVLAARQTGKSSLLRRTQDRLVTQGYRCIKLDMGAFSFERSVSQWYLSLAREIATGLRQPRDFAETLLAQDAGHPASRRFSRFLQEVLRLSDAPLVIFLDEVEGFLQMPRAVAADFLTTLRSYVDERDSTPLYRRLCFCLMGACTSSELMPGAQRTPFDIAREITLTDFDWPSVRAGLLPLFAKKRPQSEAALVRAYYWTQGHPSFMQRLCEQMCATFDKELTIGTVDRLVREIFVGPLVHEQEDFLEIERRLCAGPSHRVRRRLALYQRLLRGDKVPARRNDLVHRELSLSGLAKLVPGEPPYLAVRNPIVSSVFNASWILRVQHKRRALGLWLDGPSQLWAGCRRVDASVS